MDGLGIGVQIGRTAADVVGGKRGDKRRNAKLIDENAGKQTAHRAHHQRHQEKGQNAAENRWIGHF